MASREVIKERLSFYKRKYAALQEAQLALIEGRVKSYTIDNRQLTYSSLPELEAMLESTEKAIDELEALLDGNRPRAAFGVVIRDW